MLSIFEPQFFELLWTCYVKKIDRNNDYFNLESFKEIDGTMVVHNC